jgi:hypothetical protein
VSCDREIGYVEQLADNGVDHKRRPQWALGLVLEGQLQGLLGVEEAAGRFEQFGAADVDFDLSRRYLGFGRPEPPIEELLGVEVFHLGEFDVVGGGPQEPLVEDVAPHGELQRSADGLS